ncbi:hypothetical protein OJ997_15190 [Solirubrobacter phytolaccae]|uniref:Uncharacterized protein n=1 Tax=Solirubrobacter phytolaccae TaxID=1404360 RepID=A0A9X3N8W7_9ACTN|nr:hypothetical protein [Solirubrobacter phytolaccae]MDA0181649.1 hypothetical protein [Solirubrobacter phytolaccae]
MSEIPALRDALRDTARRHTARRRRRLTLAVAVPVALAAVVFALAGSLPRTDETLPGEATVTPTATATATPGVTLDDAERELAKVYGVFRRPARASDRPPNRLREPAMSSIELEWERARRVATLGERATYVIPTVDRGRVGLCLFTRVDAERPGGGGCGPFDPSTAMSKPIWGKTFYRPNTVYDVLLPDGVQEVTVHFKGRTVTLPTGENGFMYEGRRVRKFTWRDAEGNQHEARAGI